MTIGWKLTPACRAALLRRHPPRYPRVVADHVTLPGGAAGRDAPAPDCPASAQIVGRADDGAGVEAFVVALGGGTARPDGGAWHITWSLAEGRDARESNDVIARGWEACEREAVVLVPASW